MFERFVKDPNFWMNVFETMMDGLMVIDSDGNILYFNRAAEAITGYSKEEAMGKPCTILDSDTCVVLSETGVQKKCNLFKEGSICNKRCRIRSKTGRLVYLLKNAVVLKDSGGEVIGAVETMTDITSLYLKELELEELKQELRQEYWFKGLLGKSLAMKKLYEQIRNAAESEAPVLICGESGTGKNLVASAIHSLGKRKEKPFIHLNCASLNEQLMDSELFGHKKGAFTGAITDRMGRFEAADGGSFFLDEIGDMPATMQAKLLKALEEKVVERVGDHKPIPVDVRLISATNKDLEKLSASNHFRSDLLYRVNSIVINVPPLRERREDIPMLVAHYLKKISAVNSKNIHSINPRAMEILENHSWPGNVRQLINALEHCAVTTKTGVVDVEDLPEYLLQRDGVDTREEHLAKDQLRQTLAMYKGNRTLTAKHLGISRVTLWKRLKDLGIR